MAELQERAKTVLDALLKKSSINSTSENILNVFKNKGQRYNTKKFSQILSSLLKHHPNGTKYVEEFQSSDQHDSHLSLILLLNRIADDNKKAKLEKPNPSGGIIHDEQSYKQGFASPPTLSSTRIIPESITQDVMEIKEKIVLATTKVADKTPSIVNTILLVSPISNNQLITSKPRIFEWNFNADDQLTLAQKNIVAIPIKSQEYIVLNEVLNCLIGIRGCLIAPKRGIHGIEFILSEQIHESLRIVLTEILPIAAHYEQIQNFISEMTSPEVGQVLQALRAALRSLMKDYYSSIAQLDTLLDKRSLTMHRLLYFLRPMFHTMEVLAETVSELRSKNTRGGNVLTFLQDKITAVSGDEKSVKVLLYLAQMTAVPYMEMLQIWMLKGVIIDPYQEFLIEHNEKDERYDMTENFADDYWQKEYTIREDKIPRFFEKYAEIILKTGKYLNVIRECGKSVDNLQIPQLKFSHNDQNYVLFIQTAYDNASTSLLKVIIDEFDLKGRLCSVKGYFLLQQGDFINQYMDACETELLKFVDNVIPMKLENLLELTLRLSSAKNDKYQDDLGIDLLPYGIVTEILKILSNNDSSSPTDDTSQLKGIECFTFSYEVPWPTSIILNIMAIKKYQMIFRQLFYFKHVERVLCRIWVANCNAKRFAPNAAEQYRSAFALRQRMMNAIQNFEYYMMIEVIEPNWHVFTENLNRVKTIDEVITYHQDFQDQCLKNCMLMDVDLLKAIITLCNICIKFCEFIEEAQRHYVDAELSSMISSNDEESENEFHQQENFEKMEPHETFCQRVNTFDKEFTETLLELMKKIRGIATQNPSDKFINLIHRINFNAYYPE